MTDAPLRPAPRDRFVGSSVQFDLASELQGLRTEPSDARHGHRQKTLFKGDGQTVALFDMQAGAALPEHAAPGVVAVHVIDGELHLTVDGQSTALTQGEMLIMKPGVRHDVRAAAPAAFLLHVRMPA